MTNTPLTLAVSTKGSTSPLGVVTIPWGPDFLDVVSASKEDSGYLTPVALKSIFPVEGDTTVGEMEVTVRLSCFGKNVQTNIQVIKEGQSGKQFLFKETSAGTTFQCQKYVVNYSYFIIW